MIRCERCGQRIYSDEYDRVIYDTQFCEGVLRVCDDCANEYDVCVECGLYFDEFQEECINCGYMREGDLA